MLIYVDGNSGAFCLFALAACPFVNAKGDTVNKYVEVAACFLVPECLVEGAGGAREMHKWVREREK